MSHTVIPDTQQAWAATSHHGSGGGLIGTLMRGFAWRTGSDVAHSLFRLAPTLVIGVVLVVLLVVGVRWLRGRSRS
ncbi:hypothetical protein QRB38_13620 [Mycobacterium avium subsp. hominissuis]|uniref:hypothetical protein n=1 Tax=Mycobacterium avium TaxID=1764 RepID=UPI002666C376|nr:hypothetical protein [Mycobacterium avium]MDO2394851.1 hypothetical protein [Mycobacterium avium subsp. hominissuis]